MPPTSEVSKYGAGLSSNDGSDEEDGVAAAGSSVATSSAVVVGQQMVVHPLARLQKLDDLVGRLGDGRSDGGPEGFLDLVDGVQLVHSLLKTLWEDSARMEDKIEVLDSRTSRLDGGTISRLMRERAEQLQYLDDTIQRTDELVDMERRRLASVTQRMNEACDRRKRGRFEFEGCVDVDF